MIKELYKKYKSVILYVFFGGCTTLINIVTYWLCYNKLGIKNVPSTIIAWVAAVLFAFVTNKLFVFESRGRSKSRTLYELVSFFGCRMLTGALDVGIMAFAVDYMHWNGLLWKILSNVLVLVSNYFASKFIIFKKK